MLVYEFSLSGTVRVSFCSRNQLMPQEWSLVIPSNAEDPVECFESLSAWEEAFVKQQSTKRDFGGS